MKTTTFISGDRTIIKEATHTIIIKTDVIEPTTYTLIREGITNVFTTLDELNNWLEWA